MGKRNIRILHSELPDKLTDLPGREVQVILLDGTTRFGTVAETGKDFLVLEDVNLKWYNRKKHTHRVSASEVFELIYDVVSPY